MTKFQPHPLQWDVDRVRRFWDFLSANEAQSGKYFTAQVGEDVIDFVEHLLKRHRVRITSPVLDLGAGRGDLTASLLRRGWEVHAVDTSESSLNLMKERFEQMAQPPVLRLGSCTRIPYESDHFGTIFFCETLEHILPADAQSALREIIRVLKPNGIVVCTTPNEETLDSEAILCPECGAVFHRMQHVCSFNIRNLRALFEDSQFRTMICKTAHFQPKGSMLLRIMRALYRCLSGVRKQRPPHLIYVGLK